MKDLVADSSIPSDNRLSIGGVPPEISKNNYYFPTLLVFEYEGCIRNVKINGQIRDLSLNNPSNYNQAYINCDCKYQTTQPFGCINKTQKVTSAQEFPWWIILIVVAALIMLGKSVILILICKFLIQLAKRRINVHLFSLSYILKSLYY